MVKKATKRHILRKTKMSEERINYLYSVFKRLDKSNNGRIDRNELIHGLTLLRLCHNVDTINALFDQVDTSKSDSIEFDEFCIFVGSRESEIKKVFDEIDTDGNGLIDFKEIVSALNKIGMSFTAEEIHSFLSKVGKESDGKISYEEFRNFVMILPSINVNAIWNSHAVNDAINIGDIMIPVDIFELEAWKLLVSGGLAGIFSRTITAPLDRLKIIYQSGSFRQFAPWKNYSKVPTMRELSKYILKHEGMRAFYKGNGVNLLKIAPESSLMYFSYEKFKSRVSKDYNCMTSAERFVSGAAAGLVSQTLVYPLEVVKTRFALDHSLHSTESVIGCFLRILKTDSIKGLYRGLSASAYGIVPFAGVNLSLFNSFREQYTKKHKEEKPPTLVILLAGTASCISAQLVTYPFQSVRTKMQADYMVPKESRVGYRGFSHCLLEVLKRDGFRELYRGIGPNFYKAVPAISLSFLINENAKYYFS